MGKGIEHDRCYVKVYVNGKWVNMKVNDATLQVITVRNQVAKVIFLHVSVILFMEGGAIPVCIASGIPACLAAGLKWGTCSQGGSAPRGRPPSRKQTATVADGTHPTGMHSCCKLLHYNATL